MHRQPPISIARLLGWIKLREEIRDTPPSLKQNHRLLKATGDHSEGAVTGYSATPI
jgi:hypothetical protein